jgi:hypothetical protein
MKTQIWVYIVVAVLSIGAGVAIAGLPTSSPTEPTIVAPAASTTTVAVLAEDDPLFERVPTGEEAVAETPTSEPAADTSTAPTSTTTTTTTTTTTVAPTTTLPLPDRSTLDVAVANGAGFAGVATATSERLEELGYVDVRALEGSEIRELTVVFSDEGLGDVGRRLAIDLGIDPELVFPLADAPNVPSLREEQLLVYLGRDINDLVPPGQ